LNIHSAYWQAVLESTGQPELATVPPNQAGQA
jgi:hypothetical protein